MQIRYFQSAWGDIKNSPGWFGKLCLLALLNFIPILGSVITLGYLYGWAREIAWGAHEPLPQKLIDNQDGKFWRRGWFALVTTCAFGVAPQLISSALSGGTSAFAVTGGTGGPIGIWLLVGMLITLVNLVLSVLFNMLAWVGCMRASIYDRLSAGFQMGRIWRMFRHDWQGILRVFGMCLIVSFAAGFVLVILFSILIGLVLTTGAAGIAASGVTIEALEVASDYEAMLLMARLAGSVGAFGLLAMLVFAFAAAILTMFIDMLVFRAIGYWTMQFDVPHWRGQDDPMPFEMQDSAAGVGNL